MLLLVLLGCDDRDFTQYAGEDGDLLANQEFGLRGDVTLNSVAYASDGLVVGGLVAFPNDGLSHPPLLFGHGGDGGLWTDADDDYEERIAELARQGFVVFAPSFRGQDESDGRVELCGDEVNDAVNMMPLASEFATDGDWRALGVNEGACPILRASPRAEFVTTVTWGAPTDLRRLLDYHRGEGNDAEADAWWVMWDADPDSHSPVNEALLPPLYAAWGMDSETFPWMQACPLKDSLDEQGWQVGSYRYSSGGEPSAGPTGDCQRNSDSGDPLAGLHDATIVTWEDQGELPDVRAWGQMFEALE